MSFYLLKPRGSILIWTVLLGLMLTTLFFFVAQRLNFNGALQEKVLEDQEAELFLASFADYIESLSPQDLKPMLGEINYQGITGSLSYSSGPQKGILDAQEMNVILMDEGEVKVEWASCTQGEAGRSLEVEPVAALKQENCKNGYEYSAQTSLSSQLTLKAGPAPVSYKLTPLEGNLIYGGLWELRLELKSPTKKMIKLERQFIPSNEL